MDASAGAGQGPRFSPVTFNDHAGELWIITILALIYSTLVTAARGYVKYKMFGYDDVLIAVATVHISPDIGFKIWRQNTNETLY